MTRRDLFKRVLGAGCVAAMRPLSTVSANPVIWRCVSAEGYFEPTVIRNRFIQAKPGSTLVYFAQSGDYVFHDSAVGV